MRINKPKVVAWRWRKPVVNDHDETVGGVWKSGEAPGVPLIRLSDYEALQADYEKLRKDAERYRWLMQEDHEWPEEVEFSVECQNKSKIDAAIDEAMQGASRDSK